MKNIFIAALIAGAFSLVVTTVNAQNVQTRGPVSFATFDANTNGSISEQEYSTVREQRQTAIAETGRAGRGIANAPTFSTVDTDKDGQISAQELQVMQEQLLTNRGMGPGRGRNKQ